MFNVVKQNLEKLSYKVSCFASGAEAAEYLNGEIDGKTVGFGGSMTLAQLGLGESLGRHNTVYWHQFESDPEKSFEIRKNANAAEIYVSSVNGLAETGEIINIDGICNRIAAIYYGHEKVYLVAGRNKLAEDYESALWRARNIAAPLNAKRLNCQTPCAVNADKCYNCQSPARICRGLSVLWEKPIGGDFEIILIDEELGY